MVDKLVVMEKGDLKRKAEDDVGDWDTALFDAWIMNKKTLQRIRFYYCRNHPCQEIPDGLDKRSTNHLRVYQCPQFSMKSVGKRRKNPCLEDDGIRDLELKCGTVPHENAVWYDSDGEKLVHYFAGLRVDTAGIISAIEGLLKDYTPTMPPVEERRSTRYQEWRNHLGLDVDSGTICFTYHHQRGHPHSDPPSASADFILRSGKKTTAALDFRKSDAMIALAERVSIVFAAVDPPMWRRYREVYALAASHFRLLAEADPLNTHCFVRHYLLINMLTTPHWDLMDPPRGWVAMVVVGDYSAGELCIPELGIALPYRSGDVVYIRSWMVLHFIKKYVGNARYVILFATTFSIFKWLEKTF